MTTDFRVTGQYDGGLLGDRDDGGTFETKGDFTQLKRTVDL